MKILHDLAQTITPPFAPPRGHKFPPAMKRLSEATSRPLRWSSLRMFGRDFELRAGDDCVGALSFRSAWCSLATATAAEGIWTFKRTGIFRPEITVRITGSETDIAVFRNHTWKGGGWLEFRDGRKFRATNNWWTTRFAILANGEESLLALRASAWSDRSAEVDLGPEAERFPDLSLLLLFGWYLALVTRNDAAAAGGVYYAG